MKTKVGKPEEITINGKKKKKFKIPIASFVIAFIILIFAGTAIYQKTDAKKYIDKILGNEEEVNEQWNSDAKLIDDRLTKDYPIMFVTSPFTDDGIVLVTTICLYNDGKFVTTCYTTDTIDTYNEEVASSTAFIDLLKDEYEANISTEMSNLLTDDITPSDFRATYLKQYDIADFSLSSTVDLTSSTDTPIDTFGVTYEVDGNTITGTSHRYYSESGNQTLTIADDTGLSVLEDFFGLQLTESE